MGQVNLTDTFLAIYNEIDHYMRGVLGAQNYVDHGVLLRDMSEKSRIFADNYKDLRLFAELRNLIVHNPYPEKADPLIIPHAYLVEKYENIKNDVLHPKKALDLAIKRQFIYTTTLDSNANEVMEVMNSKTYTHVPVMEGEKMVGVFSENTILTYHVHRKDILILNDTKVGEFKEFIGLDKHPSEHFEFVSRDALLADVEALFQKRLKERKRIAVVFITQNGNPNEKLLGMLTAWDIAGKD